MMRFLSAAPFAAALLALFLIATGQPAPGQSVADYGVLGQPAAEAPEKAAEPDLAAYGSIMPTSATDMIATATKGVDVFQQRLRRIAEAAPGAWDALVAALAGQAPNGNPGYFVAVFIFVSILLVIGRGGGQILGAYVGRPLMVAMQRPNPVGMAGKLPVLATRVGLTAAAVTVSLLIAAALGAAFFDKHEATVKTAVVILGFYAIMMLVDTAWRMMISPYLPNYRIPCMTDADAIRMYRWISGTTTFAVVTNGITVWLDLMEVPPDAAAVFTIGLGLLTTGLLITMVVQNRRAISRAILNGIPRAEAPWVAALSSVLWLPVIIAYIAFSWVATSFRLVMGLSAGGGLTSGFMIFLAAMIVYAVTVYAVERIFARSRMVEALNRPAEADAALPREDAEPRAAGGPALADYEGESGDLDGDGDEEGGGSSPVFRSPEPPSEPAPEPVPRRLGMRSFEDLARRAASLFALGLAAFLLLRFWVGAEVLDEGTVWNLAGDIVDTLFFGYIVFHALRIWMDRRIAEEGGGEESTLPSDEGDDATAASRLATLLPLIRSFVLFCVIAAVILIVATRLGFNVAPLFAGAGVVGLAIGFGSQALVRDILSGMFFLVDDAFRKGEYIDLGDVKGTVEKISLRSFQLRHHLGALNTVPFGEVKYLTNYSRDWVMMKLPLRLTYDTDVEKVRKIIKKLGLELLDHPTEGPKFLQPLKSQGVFMMEDSAMVIRVKFMTRPGDQWTTRRIVYTRIREIFAEEGIKFAHREVTVHIPGLPATRDLGEAERHAIGAAARRVVDDAEIEAMAGTKDYVGAR